MNNNNNTTKLHQLVEQKDIPSLVKLLRNLMIEIDTEEILNGDTDYLRQVLLGGEFFKGYFEYSNAELIAEFRDREYMHDLVFDEDANVYKLLDNLLDSP